MAFKFVILSALLAVASAGVVSPVVTYSAPAVTVAHKVAYANPSVDAVATTHQNVVRSFGGTVSQYSKAVDTPYSSVRKEDTRISNNVYHAAPAPTAAVYTHATPVLSKTVYSAPQQIYAHHEVAQPTVVAHHVEPAPTAAVYTSPAVSKTVTYASPAPTAVYHHEAAPATVYHHEAAPTTVYHQAAPTTVYHQAAPVQHATVYHHEAPAQTAQVYHHEAPTATATTTYNHGPAASTYSHNAPGVSAYGTSQTVHYSPAEMVSHMSFDGFGTHWGF